MAIITEVGTNSLLEGGGIALGARIIRGNFRTVILPSGVTVAPLNPFMRVVVKGTALANNASAIIVDNNNPNYNIITLLSVMSSVAGIVQFLVGTDVVLEFKLAVDTMIFIPIPTDGVLVSDPASDFKLKNTTGSAINYTVNVWWSNIAPIG